MKQLPYFRALLFALLCLPVNLALAQWELDSGKSSINFVSIKNTSVAETHSFASLIGYISQDGKVQLGIDLDSVQTLIDIRDERMRGVLFETAKFPAANVTAQVEADMLAAVEPGAAVSIEVPVTLSLHGLEKELRAALVVVGERDGSVRVVSARPIVINAADFGLGAGVAALREIAGLQAISSAVPVTLHLVFTPVD